VPGVCCDCLTAGYELLASILPQRFQQVVAPDDSAIVLGNYERLIDQVQNEIEHVIGVNTIPAAHRFGCLQHPARCKDRKAGKQQTLR
jgi:hypothetical protein